MTEPKKRSTLGPLVTIAVVVAIVIGIIALAGRRSCEDKGEAYFREIGSWPRMSDGRDAAEVVRERCARSKTAFPD